MGHSARLLEARKTRMDLDTFKPTFLIQIDGRDLTRDITQEITALAFEDSEAGLDELELRVTNRNLQFTDDPLFQEGNEIVARLGYVGNLSLARKAVIKEIDYEFPDGGDLNTRMLANCWESERKFAVCCEIQARRRPPVLPTPMRLNTEELNEALLNHANIQCRIRFRQKDCYGETPRLDALFAGDRKTVRKSGDALLGRWFRAGRSRLGGGDHLNGRFKAATFVAACKLGLQWAETREAFDIVNRWRMYGPRFRLGRDALNARLLTNPSLNEDVASFELDVDTGYPRRARTETMRLGGRRLNQTCLRLTRERALPMRLVGWRAAGLQRVPPAGRKRSARALHAR